MRLHLGTVNVTGGLLSPPPDPSPYSLLWGRMAKSGLELVIFLPPGQSGSDKTLAYKVLVKKFLLRADLVKNKMFWNISK